MKNWVLGNWKMNHALADIEGFFKNLGPVSGKLVAGVAPQSLHLSTCLNVAPDNIKVGAQNCHFESKGAFTGENAVEALKELGASFILVGHSERRSLFGENDEFLAKKIEKVIANGLTGVFCVGETLEEREAGNTWKTIQHQLEAGLANLPSYTELLVVAYEPVWAIGTGKTATPDQAGEVHAQIRSWLKEKYGNSAEQTPILYGGSVKPANFAELLGQTDVNGGLVGGASLKPDDFYKLCEIAAL